MIELDIEGYEEKSMTTVYVKASRSKFRDIMRIIDPGYSKAIAEVKAK